MTDANLKIVDHGLNVMYVREILNLKIIIPPLITTRRPTMDKNDLISRSTLRDEIASLRSYCAGRQLIDPEARNTILSLIDEAPAVAPEKLSPKGKWRERPSVKSFKHTNIPVVECSRCGLIFCDIINNHQLVYHYCPNCGAKMMGD